MTFFYAKYMLLKLAIDLTVQYKIVNITKIFKQKYV